MCEEDDVLEPEPERIWLEPQCVNYDPEGRRWADSDSWDSGACRCGAQSIAYLRADVAAKQDDLLAKALESIERYKRVFLETVKLQSAQAREIQRLRDELERLYTPRPLDEWHEDVGSALWHRFPIEEPPYLGDPMCSDWPEGAYSHWTPMPDCNAIQDRWETAVQRDKEETLHE